MPLATFALQFNFYIDDKIQQLSVNGTEYKNYVDAANPNGQGGYGTGRQLSEVLSYGATVPWVHGANSIIVKSWNLSAPTGFLAQTTATAPCPPLLSITKTAATTGTLMPATDVGYTVTATNTGAVAADGTVVADPLPAGITSGSWTCSATGSAVCPSASGSLPLSQTIATFPAGGAVTYAITARVADVPPASITNTASVTRANAVCTPANCAANATNATAAPGSLVISKTIAGGPAGGVVSGSFTFAVACTLGGAQPNVAVVLAGATSGSTTVNSIPAGAQCTVTEQAPLPVAPAGYAWGTTPAAVTVTIPTGASATASATNQLKPITGSLVISKTVAGGPAGGVSGSFVFAVSCTSGGAQPNVPVVLANASSGSAAVAGIPADAQCTVTEQAPLPAAPAGYAWGATPAPVTVTIPAGGTATASATNQLSPVVINPVPTLSQWSLLLLSAMLLLMGGVAASQRRR